MLKEGFTIAGWVAMWRPMQIFLYEWWPLLRRRSIYANLARASVHVTQGKGAGRLSATASLPGGVPATRRAPPR